MNQEEQDPNEDYLWNGEGENKDAGEIEALLAPLRQTRPLRARLRRPWLSALLLASIVSVLFLAVSAAGRAPTRFVGLFEDDAVTELAMHGGSRVELTVNGGTAGRELTQRVGDAMSERGAGFVYAGDGKVVIDLPESDVDAATAWAKRIAAEGRFTMHRVIEDSAMMRAAHAQAKGTVVQGDIDQWFHEESGKGYVDYYLKANDKSHIRYFFEDKIESGDLTLPVNSQLAYERLALDDQWRSYLIDSRAEVSRDDIASASTYWNPTSGKPEVLIELTAQGDTRFEDLTAAVTGRKIAIMIDGEVVSAPSVQTTITGGSVSISMGGNDPKVMEAEANALAAVLSSAALPAGVSIDSVEYVEPSVSGGAIFAARALLASLAGLCVFAFVWPLVRFSKNSLPLVARLRGSQRRLAPAVIPALVSLAGVAAVVALGRVGMPGLGGLFSTIDNVGGSASVAALGIAPFLLGIVIAEFIAWAVPALRKGRRGSGTERNLVTHLGLALGLGLLVVQAYHLSSWLSDISTSPNNYEFSAAEINPKHILLALIACSSALYGLAKLISRYGLGNGYAVVAGALVLPQLPHFVGSMQALSVMDTSAFFQSFLVIAALFAAPLLARRTIKLGQGRQMPLSGVGIAPLLVFPVVLDGWIALQNHGHEELSLPDNLGLIAFAVTLVSALVFTLFVIRRPQADGETRIVSGVADSLKKGRLLAAFALALALPLVFSLALQSLSGLGLDVFLSTTSFVLGAALVLDLVAEFRARWLNPELVQVWELHRPRYLVPTLDVLSSAGIDVAVRGRYLRAMLSVLGPFVPLGIWVPQHRADEALELIRGQL
jgi:hypothetical protein